MLVALAMGAPSARFNASREKSNAFRIMIEKEGKTWNGEFSIKSDSRMKRNYISRNTWEKTFPVYLVLFYIVFFSTVRKLKLQ